MKARGLLLAVLAWISADIACAQEPDDLVLGEPVAFENSGAAIAPGGRFYAGLDYLLWWMKPVCLKVPVLTAGSPTDAVPGAIGQPGTRLLVGNGRFEFPGASGLRPRLGAFLTSDGAFATEVEAFSLATVVNQKQGSGSGPTYLPYEATDNTQQALPFSIPGQVNGFVTATGSSHLWGGEANLIANLLSTQWGGVCLRGGYLAGFRYLDLTDRVAIHNTQALVTNPAIVATGSDSLATHNQFYGVQLGHRLTLSWGRWSQDLVGKLAVGETRLANSFAGLPLNGAPVQPGLIPGPLQVLPSNAGEQSVYRVSLVPEVGTTLRFWVTNQVQLTLGYSLIYWNRILCPGDLMDSHVNPTQLPGRGPVTGPLAPLVQAVHTDYFTHGINAGLTIQF